MIKKFYKKTNDLIHKAETRNVNTIKEIFNKALIQMPMEDSCSTKCLKPKNRKEQGISKVASKTKQ